MKAKLNPNFFIFNPKSYLYGETLIELAKEADQLVDENVSIFVTGPYTDLGKIAEQTDRIIVTAQHLDGILPGRGMGAVLPDSLVNAGVKAVFLNHAEHPMTLAELVKAIGICQKLEIISIVCADSVEEARAIAILKPDIILCEPTELIGTGQTSGKDYIDATNQAIKEVYPQALVMQAAGISTADDVYQTILAGADGTGCTSGIVKADLPKQMLKDMVSAVKEAIKER
ncbi:triose-phosphate isomerase [Streptococcus uberis]|uniref:triose-phosphate isomerase n=1 Tax=Streptococcus uberis TaxID=1349 RepID=UPI000620351E|nr:triose-phosphate isomerase [Streptococcus uberis]KKF45145.1 triosephosphate isomerase [Streptococcus uberis EF20/0145]KKF57430.1 triosephosphate isomerase [Streptococcus uberis 6780]MCK1167588.1 triose-phosphate isomerase [Streptococcus uberis]MCK1197029.1 triose-phosphate isomerase [Streptococcus uberis]MCK1219179.1 triose-phosphate isomerase [Streptococcus uberis]